MCNFDVCFLVDFVGKKMCILIWIGVWVIEVLGVVLVVMLVLELLLVL